MEIDLLLRPLREKDPCDKLLSIGLINFPILKKPVKQTTKFLNHDLIDLR